MMTALLECQPPNRSVARRCRKGERSVRRRVLDNAGLPYVFVEFDADWRLPGDLHPNAAAARKIAVAIADHLRVALRE